MSNVPWGSDFMNPYDAENKGIKFKDFRKLQDLANEDGYVNPYRAESAGVPFSAWSQWQSDYDRKHGRRG